jgi:hypothetical protein
MVPSCVVVDDGCCGGGVERSTIDAYDDVSFGDFQKRRIEAFSRDKGEGGGGGFIGDR